MLNWLKWIRSDRSHSVSLFIPYPSSSYCSKRSSILISYSSLKRYPNFLFKPINNGTLKAYVNITRICWPAWYLENFPCDILRPWGIRGQWALGLAEVRLTFLSFPRTTPTLDRHVSFFLVASGWWSKYAITQLDKWTRAMTGGFFQSYLRIGFPYSCTKNSFSVKAAERLKIGRVKKHAINIRVLNNWNCSQSTWKNNNYALSRRVEFPIELSTCTIKTKLLTNGSEMLNLWVIAFLLNGKSAGIKKRPYVMK